MSLKLTARIAFVTAVLATALLGGDAVRAAGPVINTIAGGFANDGAAPTAVQIDTPQGVVLDSSGNQIIVDAKDCRVRRVTATAITTIAGTGGCGFGGDGGPATAASLKGPQAIAIDPAGNLYVADTGNCVIRKITTVGVISTVAGTPGICSEMSNSIGDGGPATSAVLKLPYAVAVDGVGNLYIADTGHCLIRKVAGGTISTIAGLPPLYPPDPNAGPRCGYAGDGGAATAALINGPQGVSVDPGGTVYIADTANCLVRKVFAGTISLIAGRIVDTDPGPGVVLAGRCIFDGDGLPATASGLYEPQGVAVVSGSVYIADTGNCLVRVISGTGTLDSYAGSGGCGFAGDGGAPTAAQLNLPGGIAGSGSTLYIADSANCRLRKVTGGTISTAAGNGACGYAGDGGAPSFSTLHGPAGIAVSATGVIYIADYANCRVRKIASKVITTVAGTGACSYSGDGGAPTAATLNGPQGLALDGSGNLYIADTENCRIRKVNAAGTQITTIAGNGACTFSGDNGAAVAASISQATGVALDGSGNVYIADAPNCRIRKVTGTTISTIAGNGICAYGGDSGGPTSASLFYPQGVAVNSTGTTVYIADTFNCRIRRVSGGTITTVAGGAICGYAGDGSAATAAQINVPRGVTVDASANLYIADTGNCRIRKVTGTTISTLAGSGLCHYAGDGGAPASASLNNPFKVALDASGNVLIADADNNRVRMISSVDTDGDTLGDAAETSVFGTNPNNVDTDGDGCHDHPEVTKPFLDPTNGWDFFSVPVPALFSAPNPTTDFKDSVVSASDAQSIFAYFKKGAHTGTLEYEQDLNLNSIKDGIEYDRSVAGPGKSGPPDGAIGATDAQLALSQFKAAYVC